MQNPLSARQVREVGDDDEELLDYSPSTGTPQSNEDSAVNQNYREPRKLSYRTLSLPSTCSLRSTSIRDPAALSSDFLADSIAGKDEVRSPPNGEDDSSESNENASPLQRRSPRRAEDSVLIPTADINGIQLPPVLQGGEVSMEGTLGNTLARTATSFSNESGDGTDLGGTMRMKRSQSRINLNSSLSKPHRVGGHKSGDRGSDSDEVSHYSGMSDSDDSDAGGRWWFLQTPPNAPALRFPALGIISGNNRGRIVLYNIVKRSKLFEAIIIFLVLANSVVLAFEPQKGPEPSYAFPLEVFFCAVFTIEAIMKIVGFGFFAHKGSYLRDGWNVLDFIIVLLSYLVFIPGSANFTALRTLRVLRPLRSVNAVPGLKVLIVAILRSGRKLVHVLLLAILVSVVFGIVAVQLWGRKYRLRCVEYLSHFGSENMTLRYVYDNVYCAHSNDVGPMYGDLPYYPTYPDRISIVSLGAMGSTCPPYLRCEEHLNPQYGFLSFDDILSSFVIVMQVTTFEEWVSSFYISFHVFSHPLGFLYFFLLVMFAGYFVPNLVLAVITESFSHADRLNQIYEEERERRESIRSSMLARSNSVLSADSSMGDFEDPLLKAKRLENSPYSKLLQIRNVVHKFVLNFPLYEHAVFKNDLKTLRHASTLQITVTAEGAESGEQQAIDTNSVNSFESDMSLKELEAAQEREERGQMLKSKKTYSEYYEKYPKRRPFKHRYFIGFIVLCIFLNVLALSTRHHNEPQWVIDMAEIANIVFVVVFTFEFLVMLFAVGFTGYFTDGFFLLDAIIVVLSIIELMLSGSAVFSVFRAARLLRVIKLVKSVPSLRFMIRAILGALSHTVYLVGIMFIMLYIATLMGMQLFQDMRKLEKPASLLVFENITTNTTQVISSDYQEDVVRANFDGFLFSFYAVFQVVTRDNWLEVMWQAQATRGTPVLVGAFFIVLVIVGHFVVLSLFLAILILSFEVNDHDGDDIDLDDLDDQDADAIAMEAEAEAQADVLVGSFYGGLQGRRRHNVSSLKLGKRPISFHFGHGELEAERALDIMPNEKRLSRRQSVSHRIMARRLTGGPKKTVTTLKSLQPQLDAPPPPPVPSKPSSPDPESEEDNVSEGESFLPKQKLGSRAPSLRYTHGDWNSEKKDKKPLLRTRANSLSLAVTDLDTTPKAQEKSSHSSHGANHLSQFTAFGDAAESDDDAPPTGPDDDDIRAFLEMPLISQLIEASTEKFATRAWAMGANDHPLPVDTSGGRHKIHENTVCRICGTEVDAILPQPPLVRTRAPIPYHYAKGRCARSRVRRLRNEKLLQLTEYCATMASLNEDPKYKGECDLDKPTFDNIVGILCGDDLGMHRRFLEDFYIQNIAQNTFGSDIPSVPESEKWWLLREVLENKRVFCVDGLRNGNEQLGGFAIAVAVGGFPRLPFTNGGDACGIFGPTNPIRLFATVAVNWKYFDIITAVLIALSTLVLALENPREDQLSTKYVALDIINYFFTSAFVIEMALRIVAKGFLFHRSAYLRDGWGKVDFLVVLVSVVTLPIFFPRTNSNSISSYNALLRSMKALRALRPIRLVQRNRSLKMVVTTLMKSVRGILDIAMTCSLFFLIVGILMVDLLGGRMYYCTDSEISWRGNCTGIFKNEFNEVVDRQWLNSPANFDHVGNAMLSLFQVATGQWINIMYDAIDAYKIDFAPVRDNRPWIGLIFVVFVMFSNFFMVNMFVAVVVYNFHRVKHAIDGLTLMTEEQKLWVETQRLMIQFRPHIKLLEPGVPVETAKAQAFISQQKEANFFWTPYRNTVVKKGTPKKNVGLVLRVRRFAYWLVNDHRFELTIAGAIICNVIVLALYHADQNETWDLALNIINDIFVWVFVAEMLLKWIGLGLWQYFAVNWNRFDGFIAILSLADFFLGISGTVDIPFNLTVFRVFRCFRVLRVLRLVRQASHMRILLETIYFALPSLINIYLFMVLIFFIYAIAGVQLFAKVNESPKDDGINNAYINFHSFLNAFQLLFVFTTGEEWDDVMHSVSKTQPNCGYVVNETFYNVTANMTGWRIVEKTDDCGVGFAPVYFITFMVISAFVVSNLFVEIILDNFTTTLRLERHAQLKMHKLHRFVEMWSDLDPSASMLVETARFPLILSRVHHNDPAKEQETRADEDAGSDAGSNASKDSLPPDDELTEIDPTSPTNMGVTQRKGAVYLEPHSRADILRTAALYNVPDHVGHIHFVETLIPLARVMMDIRTSEHEAREHREMWKRLFPDLNGLPIVRYHGNPMDIAKYFAASYLAAAHRRRQACRAVGQLRRKRLEAIRPKPPRPPPAATTRRPTSPEDIESQAM